MVVWCYVVPVSFRVLGVVWVIGFEVGGVVVLTRVGRGPHYTLNRGQEPFVVPRRLQQVVQNLLVRLALLEAETRPHYTLYICPLSLANRFLEGSGIVYEGSFR